MPATKNPRQRLYQLTANTCIALAALFLGSGSAFGARLDEDKEVAVGYVQSGDFDQEETGKPCHYE